MTMSRKHIPYLLPAIVVCAMLLSACDRDDLHDDHHVHGIERIEVRGVDSDVLYGVWLHDAEGWTSDTDLRIAAGEEVAVSVAFFDDHNHEVTLRDGGEYSLAVRDATDDGSGVIEWTITDNVVRFRGLEEGQASVVFLMMHGNHSDAESPAFVIEVEALVPVS